jgi:hypothetical protein
LCIDNQPRRGWSLAMRALRVFFSLLGLVVALPLGGAVLYATIQLKMVAERTQATPRRLPAAQLAQKGVPDNLFVEVTDFRFGKPVIEQTKEGWDGAWLPVEPTTMAAGPAKHALFFRANVRNQAALDLVLKRSPLEALVTTPLPKGCQWRVKSGPALRKAYSKEVTSQALFLAEPRLALLGQSVAVSDPRLHDPEYESLGAWGGGGLILFAFLCLYLMVKRGRAAGQSGGYAADADAETQRTQLQTERPDSVHAARGLGVFRRVSLYGLLAGVLGVGAVLAIGAVFVAQSQGKPLIAVLFTFAAIPTFLGAWVAFRAAGRMLRWPTDIALCPTGVRWRQGRKRRAILWAEVADIDRQIKVIPRPGPGGLLGAMAQLNNPQPPLIQDTLRITLHSGESYLMSPDLLTNYNKFAEGAATLWKDDVLRRNNAGVTDAWLKSLPRRVGAASD